jgi:hypothetical protein
MIGVFLEEFSEFSKVKIGGHEFLHGIKHGVLHHFKVGLRSGFGGLEKFLEFLYHGRFVCLSLRLLILLF